MDDSIYIYIYRERELLRVSVQNRRKERRDYLVHVFDQIKVISFVLYRFIVLVGRVFANGPGDLGSIPGRVIPKTLKMVLDTSLFNTQQYRVRFKGKVEQSREWSSALPYT